MDDLSDTEFDFECVFSVVDSEDEASREATSIACDHSCVEATASASCNSSRVEATAVTITCNPSRVEAFADPPSRNSPRAEAIGVPPGSKSSRVGDVIVPCARNSPRVEDIVVPPGSISSRVEPIVVPPERNSSRVGSIVVPPGSSSSRVVPIVVPTERSASRVEAIVVSPERSSSRIEANAAPSRPVIEVSAALLPPRQVLPEGGKIPSLPHCVEVSESEEDEFMADISNALQEMTQDDGGDAVGKKLFVEMTQYVESSVGQPEGLPVPTIEEPIYVSTQFPPEMLEGSFSETRGRKKNPEQAP